MDVNFAHTKFTSDYQTSKYVEWDRSPPSISDIVVVTDSIIPQVLGLRTEKIALLLEPRAINPWIYSWVQTNHDKFKTVLSYDKQLLESIPNSKFYPHCGCWIMEEEQKIYKKSKMLSIIASSKNQTLGHKLRHQAISILKANNIGIATYGSGYSPVNYKLEALKAYAFSLVIENSKEDFYFTEKLMDAFVTGTVPIYWGCPSIGKFFNLDGMILIEKLSDILKETNSLTFERYFSMQNAIEENFHRAKEYLLAEDWIFKNGEVF